MASQRRPAEAASEAAWVRRPADSGYRIRWEVAASPWRR